MTEKDFIDNATSGSILALLGAIVALCRAWFVQRGKMQNLEKEVKSIKRSMVDERGRPSLVTFEDMRRICRDKRNVTELKIEQIQKDIARLREDFCKFDEKLEAVVADVAAIAAVYKK